jgi:protein-S-isoprenylcysteine O-methyltransferase Ste14
MVSLLLRNLFFTILQPGAVAALVPYWIVRDDLDEILRQTPVGLYQQTGILAFAIGFVVMIICILSFAFQGRGTLSPLDPTRKLVTAGLYKFSRNPMYVGVMLILFGEALAARSTDLGYYALVVFVCFNLFIHLHEEPRLRRVFGEEYASYCRRVRRWV